MTLELDSKPTRTRKGPFAKELAAAHDQIVAQESAETEAEKWAKFDAAFEDTGEIPMDPEATAELRARVAQMGLSGPTAGMCQNCAGEMWLDRIDHGVTFRSRCPACNPEPTILVTGYDADGEAVDAAAVLEGDE